MPRGSNSKIDPSLEVNAVVITVDEAAEVVVEDVVVSNQEENLVHNYHKQCSKCIFVTNKNRLGVDHLHRTYAPNGDRRR